MPTDRSFTFSLAQAALNATVDENGTLTGCPTHERLLCELDGRVRSWMEMSEAMLVEALEGYRAIYLSAYDQRDGEICGIMYDFKEWAHAALYVRFGYTI